MATFKAVEITAELLTVTRASWIAACDEETFAVEYEGLFDYLSLGKNDPETFRALVAPGTVDAPAFLGIVSSPGAQKTKLLKVFVQPNLWDGKDRSALASLYAAAVAATFGVSAEHQTKVVKCYGRNSDMLSVLVDIDSVINNAKDRPPGIKCRMAGRWLEFTLG